MTDPIAAQSEPADYARMHTVSDETQRIVDEVLEYSRRRIMTSDAPLDHPVSEAELQRLAGTTIREEGIGASRALSIFEHVLAPSCITTDHPNNLAFIPCVPSKAAIAFDLVVSASALYGGSWIEGAGAVHAENEVLGWLASEFGLPETAGGVFVQGGTIGNLSSLVAARDRARLRCEEQGKTPPRWAVVCSAEAHSSVASAAEIMDVDVIAVDSDEGRLGAEAVAQAFEAQGERIFAVVATAGSTNFGIVDDIAGIAALKEQYDFWLHIDGAYGLTAMLSPRARHLFEGVGEADSLIVDPHKWMFAPYDVCALIYRDSRLGRRAHTQRAAYLDALTETPTWNPSDYSIQLSRRPRGLPFWFSLATHGIGTYREAVDHSLVLAQQIAAEIKRRDGFTLVREPELSVVVFERDGWEKQDYERWSADLLERQIAFVTPSSHAGRPNTRFAILHPLTTFEELCEILDSAESQE